MLDLSIVIVSWNAKGHLRACLQSLQDDGGGYSREVLVVDNASEDGSPEVVEKEFPWAVLIRNEENLGFARANNIAIERCTGRYVALINSDVIVPPECLKRLLAFMDQNPRAGLVGPRVLNSDLSTQLSAGPLPTLRQALVEAFALDRIKIRPGDEDPLSTPGRPHGEGRLVGYLKGCFVIARGEAVEQVGMLDEDFFFYSEDIDWSKRFHLGGWEVIYFPGSEAIHYGGASAENAPDRFYVQMNKEKLRYWRKHHGPGGKASAWLTMVAHQAVRVIFRGSLYVLKPARRNDNGPLVRRSLVCLRWLLGLGVAPQ